MPQEPFIPDAGQPLSPAPGAHREILAGIARAAARQDWIPAGIDAEGGSAKRDPDVPQIALFEITGKFAPGDPTDGTPNPPYGNWYSAPATKVEYYPAPAKWSTPRDAGDEDTVPLEVSVWHNAGYQIDSTDPDRDMPDSLAAAYQFMPAAGPGQWVWCFLDETVGLWVMLQPFEDIIRVQLAEDWYACDSAAANILIALGGADEWLGFATGYAVTVYDPLGAIANDLLAVSDSSGNWYMPAGTCAIVKRFADDNAWEPLRFMPGQCPTSSSSSSSSSSSGSSGSSGSSSGIESSGSGSGGGGACACQMLCPVCVDNEGRVVGGYVASLVNTGGGSGCSSGTSSFDLVVSGTWWSPIGCPEPGSSSGSSGSGSSGSGSSGSSGSGGSGWQLVAQGLTDPTNEPGPLQSTSVPMDCIGANLIVISIAYQGSAPIYLSDSEGNSWTLITQTSGGAVTQNALYYCANPAVSSSQTFHVECDTGYPLICVMAFSGAASSPLDKSSNNKVDVDGGIQPGSITPSENNCLMVTGCLEYAGEAPSVDSGFVADSVVWSAGVTYGGGIAYLVQATAAAVNPTWTPVAVSGNAAATMASFKPA